MEKNKNKFQATEIGIIWFVKRETHTRIDRCEKILLKMTRIFGQGLKNSEHSVRCQRGGFSLFLFPFINRCRIVFHF